MTDVITRIRKFNARHLTEIASDGSWTYWRYADEGVTTTEVMEDGFFTFFQAHSNERSRIKRRDLIMIDAMDGLVTARVMEVGVAPDFAPRLQPMDKPFLFQKRGPGRPPQSAKEVA